MDSTSPTFFLQTFMIFPPLLLLGPTFETLFCIYRLTHSRAYHLQRKQVLFFRSFSFTLSALFQSLLRYRGSTPSVSFFTISFCSAINFDSFFHSVSRKLHVVLDLLCSLVCRAFIFPPDPNEQCLLVHHSFYFQESVWIFMFWLNSSDSDVQGVDFCSLREIIKCVYPARGNLTHSFNNKIISNHLMVIPKHNCRFVLNLNNFGDQCTRFFNKKPVYKKLDPSRPKIKKLKGLILKTSIRNWRPFLLIAVEKVMKLSYELKHGLIYLYLLSPWLKKL